MMQCGKCSEWVHAQCEGITDEWYQILSFLPDTVEFICKLCLRSEKSLWIEAIRAELKEGLQTVFSALYGSKYAKHLIHMNSKSQINKNPNFSGFSPVFKLEKKSVINEENKSTPKEKTSPLECDSKNKDDCTNDQMGSETESINIVKSIEKDGLESPLSNLFCETNLDIGKCSKNAQSSFSDNAQRDSGTNPSESSNFNRPQTRAFMARTLPQEEEKICKNGESFNESQEHHNLQQKTESCKTNKVNDDFSVDSEVKLKDCVIRLKDIYKTKKNPVNNSSSENADAPLSSQEASKLDFDSLKCCKPNSDTVQDKISDIDKSCSTNNVVSSEKNKKSYVELLNSFKKSISGYLSDCEDEKSNSVAKKDSPYSMIAKVSKDIDDDCLSSEESSFCSSDTEIESIFDDPEDPKDLHDIKIKLNDEKYDSVLQFHVDVMRVIEQGRNVNKGQTRYVKASYSKLMKESFPWFTLRQPNIFSLINSHLPFPLPSNDHNYSDIKNTERSGTSLSCNRSSLHMRSQISPSEIQNSSQKKHCISDRNVKSKVVDVRKCLLCNMNGDADPCEAGRLLYLGQDEWLHVNCGLWSSEVYEEDDGGLQNVFIAVSRGRQIKCSYCQERGATVGCCNKSCQAAYHFVCARKSGCYFGEDKRVFCEYHITAEENLNKIEDLRVGRCVFVNMDFEKRKWRQALTNKVNVSIGSLSINNLGKMASHIESEEALIPVDFSCVRIYWSTKNPTVRVKYICRTKLMYPTESSGDGGTAFFHKTVDHSKSIEIVNREFAEIKAWQREMDRQKWERQSRHTNVIPPHMCPLYQSIVKREKSKEDSQSAKKNILPTRRQLFSPYSSMSYEEKEDSDVRLCVEDILKRITSQSEMASENSDDLDILPPQSAEENDMNIPSTDENNEIMASIVNADDNEIISMVLKDLAVFESSVFQSTPSTSGRASPLDLDILAVCDPAISSDGKNSDKETSKIECKTQEISELNPQKESLNSYDKSFLGADHNVETQLICQKILEVCDAQIQSQILTFDQSIESQNNTIDNHCDVETNPVAQQSSYLQGLDQNSCFALPSIPEEQKQNLMSQPSVSEQNFNPNHNICQSASVNITGSTISQSLNDNSLYYSQFAENSSLPVSSMNCSFPVSSNLVSSFPADACKDCYMTNNLQIQPDKCSSNIYDPGKGSEENYESLNQLTACSGSISLYDPEGAKRESNQVGFEREFDKEKQHNALPKNGTTSFASQFDISESHSLFNPPSSSGSSCSSKKQVCRVLPMLCSSASSRRGSSASDHSDGGGSAATDLKSPPIETNSKSDVCSLTDIASENIPKKRKIQMKRNYRTVIKKYPLRSAFRKHAPYKTVQIEINETIEIPSEDEEPVCHQSVKRKWNEEVIDTKEEPMNEVKGHSKRRRKVFQSCQRRKSRERTCDLSMKRSPKSETKKEETKEISKSNSKRSHQVLKFSDNHNAITVSIVNNNNLCNFTKRKRRHRLRRKTVLQLDGAADDSSSEATNASDNDDQLTKCRNSSAQSNLALRIKEQSLARSSPGEEGPFKCSKCKRLYRYVWLFFFNIFFIYFF